MPNVSVSDDHCFGRAELLDRILRRAQDLAAGYRQNLAFVGPPRIGKSTLLLRSLALLKQSPPLLPIYLELRADATLGEFAEQFASTVLYRYWSTRGREAPQTLEALSRLCAPYLPRTTRLLAQGVAKARRGRTGALTELFEAPGQLRQESGRLCVIMLDEFHRLGAWGKVAPFATLSQQIVVQKETMYVLASSAIEEARRILHERLAVLFGHFELIEVGPFDLATSVRFLRDHAGLEALGRPALIAVADLTQGHPFYLDSLAKALAATEGQADSSTEERIRAALDAVLWRATGVLAQQSQQAIAQVPARRRAALMPVLLAVAHGHHRPQAVAEATGRTPAEVSRALRRLVEAGLVTRHGVFYSMPDRLVRFWLTSVYRVQHGSVHLEPSAGSQAFSATVREWLLRATTRAPQTVLETVSALMRRFHNEIVTVHDRRVRLPVLEVHTLLLPGIPRAVVGRRLRQTDAAPRPSGQRGQAQWLCVPYTTWLREADAILLVQTVRHVAKPWERQIVIALEGMDVGAKLFLQEQRFWVWELPDLNHLLDLYGLPRLLPTELQELAAVAEVAPAGAPPAAPSSEEQQVSA